LIVYYIRNNPLSCLSILFLTLLFGCASIAPFPPGKPFSPQDTAGLISNLRSKEGKILTFQGIGTLNLKQGKETIETCFFTVGSNHSKIRLEITHPWGKPLLHMVADKSEVSVLSLTDKKFFQGPPHAIDIRQFFLGGMDLDLVWKIFSASLPLLPAPGGSVSLNPLEISLLDGQGEMVERIHFSSRSLLPRSIYLPKRGLTIMVSEFKHGDVVGSHPLRIKVLRENKNQVIIIRYRNLIFNKPVPQEIFQLNPPPNFEIIHLNNS
jgi:hypothetical protein